SMLGQASEIIWPDLPPRPDPTVPPVAEMRNVYTDTGLHDVSLDIRPGEIVGLIGLVGAGRTEIGHALFGADRIVSGSYKIDGVEYPRLTIPKAVELGVALVPEDRRKQGLVLTQTTRPNISLASLAKISNGGILKPRTERERAKRMIEHFGIVPGKIDGEVAFYSGGNQQKVLLSKWAVDRPKILILDEPSRGVDIGARQRIHEFIV
ncbi:MAG: sugar ABC transporter ATP-binding protein, partial [Propionibacteriaceae bacterium]|nr:sugar ABC transporter ATP-binding protein [Propionibacteriaceae bacterium]